MDIDTDILISAVECGPILWDKSQELYRDRNGTKNAWEEVCSELKSNFNSLQNSEKNEFGEFVYFLYIYLFLSSIFNLI